MDGCTSPIFELSKIKQEWKWERNIRQVGVHDSSVTEFTDKFRIRRGVGRSNFMLVERGLDNYIEGLTELNIVEAGKVR